jgi:hypothetical protein
MRLAQEPKRIARLRGQLARLDGIALTLTVTRDKLTDEDERSTLEFRIRKVDEARAPIVTELDAYDAAQIRDGATRIARAAMKRERKAQRNLERVGAR